MTIDNINKDKKQEHLKKNKAEWLPKDKSLKLSEEKNDN